ncbi:MAG: cytochrome C [Betaproteobacteria bacterium]|jgi:cytochrome c|nr:MAG: cytochrome C [Betaproteobacteria bacterium]
MKLFTAILATAAIAAFAAPAAADIFAENGCIGCHDATKKKMGPTWKDIAAKRAGDKAAIVHAIKEGSKGVYGKIPMPAQAKAAAHADALADAILAVK